MMKCPKCNKEYNSMEEILKCLSKHIEDEKAMEKAMEKQKREQARQEALENIRKEFAKLATKVREFNTTYPEMHIDMPTFNHKLCTCKKEPDTWNFLINGKKIEDLDTLINRILW